MAVRDDGRYYTDDSFYSDTGNEYADTSKGHRLPGNTQEKVLVEGRLVYLKTFEQFIAKHTQVEYRNLARTGVRISGASYQTYEEALDWIGEDACSGPFVDKVSHLLDNQGHCPDLSLIYGPARKYVEELFEEVLPTALETELLPEKFAGTNYSDNKQIAKLLNKAGQVKLRSIRISSIGFSFRGKTNPNWSTTVGL